MRLAYPPSPPGRVLYAIGDIHGRLDLLTKVHRSIDEDRMRTGAASTEIYLGDYLDRGPEPSAVIQSLIDRAGTHDVVCLRGNHEQLLLDFLQGEVALDTMLALGAQTTFASYGVAFDSAEENDIRERFRAALPPDHLGFMEAAPFVSFIGAYVFVHAGLRPGIARKAQTSRDMIWIRDEFLDYDGDFDGIVVHGHTPVEAPEFKRNRINIDTGAFITNKLTCLKISAAGAAILEGSGAVS